MRAAISLEFESNAEISFSIIDRDNYGGMHLHYKNLKKEEFDIQKIRIDYSQEDIRIIASNFFKNGTNSDSFL